jgi:hypothetical protein
MHDHKLNAMRKLTNSGDPAHYSRSNNAAHIGRTKHPETILETKGVGLGLDNLAKIVQSGLLNDVRCCYPRAMVKFDLNSHKSA